MHPAPSVIIFTTLSGLGFGMMALLGLGFGPSGAVAGPLTAFFALAFAGGGLMASTFHLGNPQRFLLAFTQWRSSWLSREGCVSALLMALFALYALGWAMSGAPSRLLGIVCAALAIAAVYCTAMIYTQLKTVPRWSTPLTPVMFFGAAAAGGALALGLAQKLAGEVPGFGLALILLAGCGGFWSYRRGAKALTLKAAGSSPETATGQGALGTVRLLEAPHSERNYLMNEMVGEVARGHAEKLAKIAALAGVLAPVFLFIISRDAGGAGAPGMALALVLHGAGVLASRWLFFAEAEHVVGLYYGRR